MEQESPNKVAEMSFGDHIVELRKVLLRAAIVYIVVAIVLFIYKGVVLDILFAPMKSDFPINRFFDWISSASGITMFGGHDSTGLYNNKLAGQFMLHMKSSLVGALVVTFPIIIWQLWLFVRPALPKKVVDKSKSIVLEITFWFIIGLLFGYYVMSPLAVGFLIGYEVSDSIHNIIDVNSYMSTVMGVTFASAMIFQLPMLVKLLANIGIVTTGMMKKYRKIAFIVLLIIAAIITPSPDVVSQILIFIPMYGLYEYGILTAKKIEKHKAARAEIIEITETTN